MTEYDSEKGSSFYLYIGERKKKGFSAKGIKSLDRQCFVWVGGEEGWTKPYAKSNDESQPRLARLPGDGEYEKGGKGGLTSREVWFGPGEL